MPQVSMLKNAAALGLALLVVTACGDQIAGTVQSTAQGGDGMDQISIPACGERVDTLPGRVEGLQVTGEFPPRTGREGGGTFAGTVKVTSTGAEVKGVATPEADVYVARAGEVVATPAAKDSVGQVVDLRAGMSQVFAARGSIRQCAGEGGLLPAGKYEVFAVVLVNRDDGPAVVVAGGPWPLEVG